MAKRLNKTISRVLIVNKVNQAMTSELSPIEKLAIADFVNVILLAGKSYNGYIVGKPGDPHRLDTETFQEMRLREVSTRKYL